MAEEMREPIRISIDHDGACTQFFNGVNIQGIRVFPACKYADCGPRTLSPSELNEAVQMWLNRADLMEKIRVLESQAHVMYCCNGDVAKDIGDLTLRVDNLESFREWQEDNNKDHFALLRRIKWDDKCLAVHMERIKVLETSLKSLKDLEKGVEISHDRCLRLETAFKSLKEEVNGMSITAENGTIYSLKVKREL